MRRDGWTVTLPLIVCVAAALTGCKALSEGLGSGDAGHATDGKAARAGNAGTPAPIIAPARALPPLAFADFAPAGAPCVREDAAELSKDLEERLARISPAPKGIKRVGYSCPLPVVALGLDYGDAEVARRAALRFAGGIFQGASPRQHHSDAEVLQRNGIIAVIVGASSTSVARAFVRDKQFVPAIAGRTLTVDAGPAGNGAAFGGLLQHTPSPFDYTIGAKVSLGCRKPGAPGETCKSIAAYDALHYAGPARNTPEVLLGTCTDLTGVPLREEPCWLLYSPLGVDLGKVSALGTKPGASERDVMEAVLDRGPGYDLQYVQRTGWSYVDKPLALSVRDGDKTVVAVLAQGNDARLIGGFARAAR